MKEIKAVIGKNFGDEGKGKCVDRLCAEAAEQGKSAVVVRHNGGAQAGHTVEDGSFRFVFHQLGSGCLRDAPFYWSGTFLPDPVKLGEEVEAFERERVRAGRTDGHDHGRDKSRGKSRDTSRDNSPDKGRDKSPDRDPIAIYASPDCTCVTIYDVLLNSLTECLRRGSRHGSCGMGIYETVRRSKSPQGRTCTFRLGELEGRHTDEIAGMLKNIRDCYVPDRMEEICGELQKELKTDFDREMVWESEWAGLIRDDNVLWNAAELMRENYNRYVITAGPGQIFDAFDTVIFEGAQGLLLDEDNTAYYPHLTPSHTGLFNVDRLLRAAGSIPSSMEVHYVTRTYVTRHGAGRLDHECRKEEINPNMMDLTNVPNAWQGALRYAKHPSADEFFAAPENDLKHLSPGLKRQARPVIEITHPDETEQRVLFHDRAPGIDDFRKECEKKGYVLSVL